MFNRPVKSFVPSIYEGIVDMDELIQSQQELMDVAKAELMTAFANTFVLTSDESGVIMFEKMLNIIPNLHTENLEFRRQRVLNRLSTRIPFTFKFLKQKLDEIIGVNAWKSYVDFDKYTLYVESSAVDQNWYSELEFTINRIKPCNLVFINVPYTSWGINVSEEISYANKKWMYRLGNWKLGQYPFSIDQEGGVVKMRELRSLKTPFLEDVARFVLEQVSYVVINDEIMVQNLVAEESSGGTVTVQYTVDPSMTDVITNIKLMNSDHQVLTDSNVYVPVTQTVYSKHSITIKEGV